MLHKNVVVGDNHYLQQWEPADSTARLALTVAATDVGKVARQVDTNVFYILTDDSPMTWQVIGSNTSTVTGTGSANGTNTGDQNLFSTIAVSGQSNVVADTTTDTLTLVAGTNVTITTDAGTDAITINASGGSSNSFATIAVSGQSDVVADSSTDTLTLVAGTNITITTNAGTDTITINSSGGGGNGSGSNIYLQQFFQGL